MRESTRLGALRTATDIAAGDSQRGQKEEVRVV